MKRTPIQHLINHIVFVIDRSGSMGGLEDQVVKVFDNQIRYLASRSKEVDQETRVSVYLFDNVIECLLYDMDVLRLPSLRDHYRVRGSTALIDATDKAIRDLQKTPELYGDHAFLIYVLTDGQENMSDLPPAKLKALIGTLADNWTLGVLVPNQSCVFEAKKFGFPPNNIQVWNTTKAGVTEVGATIQRSTESFFTGRSTGVRGTKSLFTLDTSNLDSRSVRTNLSELSANDYELLPVRKDAPIKEYIESFLKQPYTVGSGYYQLTKKEAVQSYKQVCIQNKRSGKVYSGANARQMLGLPDYEVKVAPDAHPDFDIFIQSTSVNRKLLKGTKLIVVK